MEVTLADLVRLQKDTPHRDPSDHPSVTGPKKKGCKGKKPYERYGHAQSDARAMNGKHTRDRQSHAYRCTDCGLFHVGGIDPEHRRFDRAAKRRRGK